MYAIPHMTSEKGDNKGSCSALAKYLLKDNLYFFNEYSEEIGLEEAIALIDDNSKRGLGANDAKWYAPVYALSEEESQHIAYKLFERKVENYADLTEKEKADYNEYIVMLGKIFQDEMARNFQKGDLGIKGGKDLFYVGVVENKRKFSYNEKTTMWEENNNNEEKRGFNTHIHIIQSRLANNGKYSKISPVTSYKKTKTNNLGARVGFDRGSFFNRIENKFDLTTRYQRKIKDTFEYKNTKKKKGSDLSFVDGEKYKSDREELAKIKEEFILNYQAMNKKITPKKYIESKQKDEILSKADNQKYFDYLVQIGLLTFEKEEKERRYYRTLRGEQVGVNRTGWKNFSTGEQGQIIKAFSVFERKNFVEALHDLAEMEQMKIEVPKKKPLELISQSAINYEYLHNIYNDLGLEELDKKYLTPLKYKGNDGKEYRTLGIQNNGGGFYAYNEKFKSFMTIGKGGITVIDGKEKDNKNIVVFKDYMEYMAFLKMRNMTHPNEMVVILNDKENAEEMVEFLKKEQEKKGGVIGNFNGKDIANILNQHGVDFQQYGNDESYVEQLKTQIQNTEQERKKGIRR